MTRLRLPHPVLLSLGFAIIAAPLAAAYFANAHHALAQPQPNAAGTATPSTPAAATAFGGAARIALVAGDGHAGLRDGASAQARFADPYGLALDPAGTLYIADAGDNNRIRRISADGQVSSFAGGHEGFHDGRGAAASFNTPSGLALDAAGNLYVADTGNHAIRKVAPDGSVTTLAGTGVAGFRDGPAAQAQFNGPLAVAVDTRGRVLVADTYNDRIRVITPDGQVATLAGGETPGFQDGLGADARFDTPCGLAVDSDGNTWIADTRNNAIRKLDPFSVVSTLVRSEPHDEHSPLRRPLAVAVGHDGTLYVGTARGGMLLQVSPTGQLRTLVGDGAVRLSRPTAVVIDRTGWPLVSDAPSYRVHRIDAAPEGQTTPQVVAGDIGPAIDQALPETRHRWPLQPQLGWHEVVGTPGEVRGNGKGGGKGESRDHLHDGLDVRGDVGAPVLAIADAKVSNPLGAWAYGQLGEGIALDTLSYVHVRVGRNAHGDIIDTTRFQMLRDAAGKPERVRMRRGTRFVAGDMLGSINGMAHVHLSLGASGYERAPAALGFDGFTDRQAPHIDSIALIDAAGQRLVHHDARRLLVPRDADGVQIIVDAWDQVDRNEARRRLGLQSLGYQLLQADGQPAPGFEQARMTLDFTRLPVDDAAVELAYAADSGITVQGRKQTRFLYQVTNTVRDGQAFAGRWQTSALPPGDYTLHIVALDHSGNLAKRGADLAIRLR